ncbi:MAG: hypothetical protein AB1716_09760 [Planctomycetota bacterium]
MPLAATRAAKIVTIAGLVLGLAVYGQFYAVFDNAWRHPPLMDDALAFCRYADHILAGWGIAWNPGGPQTYGCTSLLYLFWITLLRSVIELKPWEVLLIGSLLPALAALPLLGAACARAASDSALRSFPAGWGFVALCVIVQSQYLYHAFSGMDTTLGLLANAVLILVAVDPRLPRSAWRAALAAGVGYLAFLARPDNLLCAVLFPGLLILLAREPRVLRVRGLLWFGGALAVLLAADTLVKTAVFGSPLPLPFYAKQAGFYDGYVGAANWNAVGYQRDFLLNNAIPLAVLVFTISRHAWRITAAAAVPALLTWGYLASVTQIMGMEARFYYPSLPFLILAAWHALDTRVALLRVEPTISGRTIAARCAALAALAALLFPVAARAERWYAERCRRLNPSRLAPGLYADAPTQPQLGWGPAMEVVYDLVRRCPREAVWAMSEHGLVGATNPDVVIIDLVGLHDRSTLDGAAPLERIVGQPARGRAAAANAVARGTNSNRVASTDHAAPSAPPDAIWFPHSDYTGLVNALASSPRFNELYLVWPGAFDYGFAIRRDTRFRPQIQGALRETWRKVYNRELPAPARPVTRHDS